jgi:hypothetical protein
MISYNDYRFKFDVRGKFSSPELYFCRVGDLGRKMGRMDLDVYLPTKGRNLQRAFVWTELQCQELIMSILVGRAIPPIRYVSLIVCGEEDRYEIIDGKQRISALWKFVHDEFPIEIGGALFVYSNLPTDFKSAIDRYQICGQAMVQNFDKNNNIIPITDEDKIKWFKFLNFAGTPVELEHLDGL